MIKQEDEEEEEKEEEEEEGEERRKRKQQKHKGKRDECKKEVTEENEGIRGGDYDKIALMKIQRCVNNEI